MKACISFSRIFLRLGCIITLFVHNNIYSQSDSTECLAGGHEYFYLLDTVTLNKIIAYHNDLTNHKQRFTNQQVNILADLDSMIVSLYHPLTTDKRIDVEPLVLYYTNYGTLSKEDVLRFLSQTKDKLKKNKRLTHKRIKKLLTLLCYWKSSKWMQNYSWYKKSWCNFHSNITLFFLFDTLVVKRQELSSYNFDKSSTKDEISKTESRKLIVSKFEFIKEKYFLPKVWGNYLFGKIYPLCWVFTMEKKDLPTDLNMILSKFEYDESQYCRKISIQQLKILITFFQNGGLLIRIPKYI